MLIKLLNKITIEIMIIKVNGIWSYPAALTGLPDRVRETSFARSLGRYPSTLDAFTGVFHRDCCSHFIPAQSQPERKYLEERVQTKWNKKSKMI